MTLTLEDRDIIARRLAEIRTERETLPGKPRDVQAQRVAQLNRERTDLVRSLADELTPKHREVIMQRLTEIVAELDVIGRAVSKRRIKSANGFYNGNIPSLGLAHLQTSEVRRWLTLGEQEIPPSA